MNVVINSWRTRNIVNFPIVNNSLHVIKLASWANLKITQHTRISTKIDWQYLVCYIWKIVLRSFVMLNNVTLFMWKLFNHLSSSNSITKNLENQVVLPSFTQKPNSIDNIFKRNVICISCNATSMRTNLNESSSIGGMLLS